MQKLIIISLLLTTNLFSAKTKNNDDCKIFNEGITYTLERIAKDTIVCLNKRVNYFNLNELKILYNIDLKSDNSIEVNDTSTHLYFISNDSYINCNFHFKNIEITDSLTLNKFDNEKYSGKIPSFIMTSNILYVDNIYAYIRIFTITPFNGNMTLWLIFKKDKNKWVIFKKGIYV